MLSDVVIAREMKLGSILGSPSIRLYLEAKAVVLRCGHLIVQKCRTAEVLPWLGARIAILGGCEVMILRWEALYSVSDSSHLMWFA